MQCSGAIPNVHNSDFSECNPELIMHGNEIVYYFEAVSLKNLWKNFNIIESFHKEHSQGLGTRKRSDLL